MYSVLTAHFCGSVWNCLHPHFPMTVIVKMSGHSQVDCVSVVEDSSSRLK